MQRIIGILLFVLLFASCEDQLQEQEQEPDPIKPGPRFTLIAGNSTSDSINYHKFNPLIRVKGKRYGVDTNYYFHDSLQLDLNKDNILDLHFEYYKYLIEHPCDDSNNNDTIVVCCFPDAAAFCRIRSAENVDVSMEQFGNTLYPKVLRPGETIDSRNSWSEIGKTMDFSMASTGLPWDDNLYESYLGFRIRISNDTTFGWIRLNTNYTNYIDIHSYAIEK